MDGYEDMAEKYCSTEGGYCRYCNKKSSTEQLELHDGCCSEKCEKGQNSLEEFLDLEDQYS